MQTDDTANQPSVDDADAAAAAAAEATNNEDAAKAAAEEDAAFESGFAAVTGTPEPTSNDADPADQSQASDARQGSDDFSAQGDGDSGTPAAPPQYLTREEADKLFQERIDAEVNKRLKEQEATFQQELRKVHGSFGGLNGRVEELTRKKPVQFNKLRENYPELAEDLAADLGESGGIFGGGAVDRDAILNELRPEIEAKVTEQAQAKLDALNERYLNFMSPGWDTKVASEDFGAWLGTLPPDEATKIQADDDPFAVADSIRRFDAWTSQQQDAAREADAKAKRLAGAEPAGSGRGGMPPNRSTSDEAAFEAGFNSVRGARR